MKKILSLFLLCLAITLVSCSDSNDVDDGAGTGLIKATFRSMVADGGATVTTTKLTLTFDKDIEGLAVADLTLTAGSTGAVKGVLVAKGSGVYELGVTGVAVGGEVTLTVSKAGYEITQASQIATVYYVNPVKQIVFSRLTANGSATETTTKLTLTFDKDIEGLVADDISLMVGNTGAVKGVLTANGSGVYELGVTGITVGGAVTVTVSKAGHEIIPASQTVTVYYAEPAEQVAFVSLTANGSATEITTKLILTLDKYMLLNFDEVVLTGNTGAVLKDFSFQAGSDNKVLELNVKGIKASGDLTVTINKAGYEITPASRTVPVYYRNIVGEFYYSDKTHSAQRDPVKECIGIVFWQNPDDATKGKIVSLDGGQYLFADDAKIWARLKGGSWSLSTKEELQYLWCTYNGVAPVTWEWKTESPCPPVNAEAQALFNNKLTAAGGNAIENYEHWTSEYADTPDVWFVNFRNGFTTAERGNISISARAVLAF